MVDSPANSEEPMSRLTTGDGETLLDAGTVVFDIVRKGKDD